MNVEYVVGEVGFGNNFAPEAEFHKVRCEQLELQVKELQAQLAEKQRHVNVLRRCLQRCAALAPEVADEKHEVLLKTAPKSH